MVELPPDPFCYLAVHRTQKSLAAASADFPPSNFAKRGSGECVPFSCRGIPASSLALAQRPRQRNSTSNFVSALLSAALAMEPTSFFAELKRRNVIRMAGLYLVGAWLLTQVASTVLPTF